MVCSVLGVYCICVYCEISADGVGGDAGHAEQSAMLANAGRNVLISFMVEAE